MHGASRERSLGHSQLWCGLGCFFPDCMIQCAHRERKETEDSAHANEQK